MQVRQTNINLDYRRAKISNTQTYINIKNQEGPEIREKSKSSQELLKESSNTSPNELNTKQQPTSQQLSFLQRSNTSDIHIVKGLKSIRGKTNKKSNKSSLLLNKSRFSFNLDISEHLKLDLEDNDDFNQFIIILSKPSQSRSIMEIKILEKHFDNVSFFRKIKGFISEEEYAQIINGLSYERFNNYKSIFRSGEQSNNCYIILKGSLLVLIPSLDPDLQKQQTPQWYNNVCKQFNLEIEDLKRICFKYTDQEIQCELQDDMIFGDLGTYFKVERTSTVITKTSNYVHLAVINMKLFDEIMQFVRQSKKYRFLVNFVQDIPLFKNLDYKNVNTFLYFAEEIEYKHGNYIYQFGDIQEYVYIIIEGEVEVQRKVYIPNINEDNKELQFLKIMNLNDKYKDSIEKYMNIMKGGNLEDFTNIHLTFSQLKRKYSILPVAKLGPKSVFGNEQGSLAQGIQQEQIKVNSYILKGIKVKRFHHRDHQWKLESIFEMQNNISDFHKDKESQLKLYHPIIMKQSIYPKTFLYHFTNQSSLSMIESDKIQIKNNQSQQLYQQQQLQQQQTIYKPQLNQTQQCFIPEQETNAKTIHNIDQNQKRLKRSICQRNSQISRIACIRGSQLLNSPPEIQEFQLQQKKNHQKSQSLFSSKINFFDRNEENIDQNQQSKFLNRTQLQVKANNNNLMEDFSQPKLNQIRSQKSDLRQIDSDNNLIKIMFPDSQSKIERATISMQQHRKAKTCNSLSIVNCDQQQLDTSDKCNQQKYVTLKQLKVDKQFPDSKYAINMNQYFKNFNHQFKQDQKKALLFQKSHTFKQQIEAVLDKVLQKYNKQCQTQGPYVESYNFQSTKIKQPSQQ